MDIKNVLIIAFLALVIFLPTKSNKIPTPQPDNFRPAESIVEVVKPVESILKKSEASDKKEDAAKLSQLYKSLGDLVALDATDGHVGNTEQLREAHRLSGKLMHLSIKGKYDGLADAVNHAIEVASGGKQVKELDGETRTKVKDMMYGLSWACQQASK